MSNLAVREGKKLELKKHINAIHCSNNLTLVQRKLFNALLFNAYHDLQQKQKFQIKGTDLCALIGYHSKDTVKLKDALFGLITIAIEWNVIDCANGKEKHWKASSILASAELAKGMCTYEYSQVMKEFFYQPEIYGRINIGLISKFKSSYGLALYENCIRYQGLSQTPWFPVEVFRKLMGVFDEKYITFRDFKKRVLDIAVKEVNYISPLQVTPEVERINQKVTKIRFKLTNAKSSEKIEPPISIEDDDTLTTLLVKTFGLAPKAVAEIIATHDESYIQEKVDIITQAESFKSGKINGLAGYLIEALKKDYKPNKSSKVLIEEKRKTNEIKSKEKEKKDESRADRYRLYLTKKIDAYLLKLTEAQHEVLMAEFEKHMQGQSDIFYGLYKKKGLEHQGINGCFKGFIKESKREQLGELLSMDDFIALIDESN